MKIRIQNQKLIYRLQNEDLAFLERNKYCEEFLYIGNQQLLFSLQSQNIDKEKIVLQNNKIDIIIPEIVLSSWLHSDVVELEYLFDNTQIIIEKDLKEFRRHASR